MRILITNGGLRHRSGTESYAIDLGTGLRDRGHDVVFFSPRLGETAQNLAASGFQVTDRLSDITSPPDIIHGQHTVPALRAACAFPEVPLVYICHDAISPPDAPPPAFMVDHYAAVDQLTRRRIENEAGVPETTVEIFGNVVDTRRFTCRNTFAQSPRRALIYSGSTRSSLHFEAIRSVCADIGLPLDEAGEPTMGFFDHPENHLPDYDIVFCKARCAIEAMATGAFVILIGDSGMGPAINKSNIDDLRAKNFGRETLIYEFSESRIRSRVEAYDPAEAKEIAEWAQANLKQSGWLNQVEASYETLSSRSAKRAALRELPVGARLDFKDWRLRLNAKQNCVEFVQLQGLEKILRDARLEYRRLLRRLRG